MKHRRLPALAVLLALAAALVALLPAQQYVVRAYRQADGLKNLGVRSLALDCQGFLWLATENGAFRFQGSSFARFGEDKGIVEHGVQEVLVDRACTVWAGTTHNLYRFDGERFQPANQTPIRVLNAHGMAAEDERRLLVVDNGRLFRLEHAADGRTLSYTPALAAEAPKAFPALASVSSVSVSTGWPGQTQAEQAKAGLAPAAPARIWVGAGGRLYGWTEPGAGQAAAGPGAIAEWGSAQGLTEDHWESVVEDHEGTVWAEGWSHIEALPRGATRWIDRTLPVAAQGNFFLRARLLVDRQGRVLAPADAGVARWQGGRWQIVDRQHGLPRNNQIGGMVFDGAGDLWLGSYGDGLYNWAGYEQWEGWGDDKRLPSAIVWAIDASHPERVIAGTDKGPAWVEPDRVDSAGTGAGAESGPLTGSKPWTYGLIVAMGRDRDGSLWIAANSGSLLKANDKTGSTVQIDKLPASILTAFEDAAGRLFLGTDDGIYERETSNAVSRAQRVDAASNLMTRPEIDANWVDSSCLAADGTGWFLTGNRLLHEQNGAWSAPPIDGLPGRERGRLLALSCGANGDLWLTGQRVGVWKVTQAGGRLSAWHLEPPPALSGIDSYAILADSRGWVWLGTEQGLLAWNGSAWRHLTQESGMIWNDVDEWGLTESRDGSVWVGTSGGLAHLMHPERIFDSVALGVSITGVDRGEQQFQPGAELTLPWSPLPLRFELSSPLVRNRSELVFRYQVEGLPSGWIESKDGLVVLPGLSPGHYTFTAMAFNPGLNAASSVVTMRLVILPPWWRRGWFLALAALALLLLLAAAARFYERHLRARSLHLEQLVRQRTRELEESREQLRIQATYDGLTGMLNRSAILKELTVQMDQARAKDKPLMLALADVDHFKAVNDAHGHLAGDEALRRFAAAIRVAVRTYDSVGRYGGEEFLLLLVDVPTHLAQIRLDHLHAAVTNLRVRVEGAEVRITCSIGATAYDPAAGPVDPQLLLAAADRALYAAKAAGRNRAVFEPAVALAAGRSSAAAAESETNPR